MTHSPSTGFKELQRVNGSSLRGPKLLLCTLIHLSDVHRLYPVVVDRLATPGFIRPAHSHPLQWPCSVSELSATSGLPRAALLDLAAKYPALASLASSGLLSGLEELSGLLEVTLADVLEMVTLQPTLLLAKVWRADHHSAIWRVMLQRQGGSLNGFARQAVCQC